jgi:TPR repeat protein
MPAMVETAPPIRSAPEATRPEASKVVQAPAKAAQPVQEEYMQVPAISGPSFLGLNKPAAPRNPARLVEDRFEDDQAASRIPDSRERYSSSVDYLLEDEQEPKRGWAKLAAVVIALALLGGFGYLRWRQGGFDWLTKDYKTKQSAEATPGTTDAGAGTAANSAPADGAPPNSAAPNPVAPTGNAEAATGTAPLNGSAPGDAVAGAATTVSNSTAPIANPPDGAAANPTGTVTAKPSAENAGNNATSDEPDTDSNTASSDARSAPVETSDTTPPSKADVSNRKLRTPKPAPTTPTDPTAEAERYIYGHGVPQDCDRGLRLLKPAAAHSNVKAMITLGSLYSSGTCAPRDLPTAYRYFALALHEQPENPSLQTDLQNIWAKMTQPERQLAIKLSQ